MIRPDRTASTLYIFDENCIFYENKNVIFDPSELDIRWVITTKLTFLKYIFFKINCFFSGLKPNEFLKLNQNLFKSINDDEYSKKLVKFIFDILDNDKKLTFTDFKIERIFYINNDLSIIKKMNAYRNYKNDFYAVTLIDFKNRNINNFL